MSETENSQPLSLPRDIFLLPKQNVGFQIPYFLSSEEELAKIRPPAVVKTLEQRLQELTQKERDTLVAFKKKVKATAWYNEEKHDDWMLIRYLKARNFDIKKSFEMIEKSVRWRQENDVDNWVCDTCLRDPNQHMMQFVGWDLQYRPVCFMSMRWGPERKEPLKHCVCAFNHLTKLMPVGVEQWVCMTDFETYSHLRDSNPKMGSTIIRAIQDHFPERLGLMVLINSPKTFSFLWKLFCLVIDEKTKTKARFMYLKSKPSIREEFGKIFPPALCDYLCDSYRRSKKNVLPTTLIWHPSQNEDDNSTEANLESSKNSKSTKSSKTSHKSNQSNVSNSENQPPVATNVTIA